MMTRVLAWLAALPLVAKIGAGLFAVLLILGVSGALQSKCSAWRDARVDAKVDALQQQIDAKDRTIAEKDGALAEKDKQLEAKNAEIKAKDDEIAAMAERAKEQDAKLQGSGQAYTRARRGRGGPARVDTLDRDLKELYPAEP